MFGKRRRRGTRLAPELYWGRSSHESRQPMMMPFACMSLHAICTLNTKKPYEALAKAAVFSAAYICIRRWNSGIFKILFFSHFWYICLFLCSFGYAIGTCLIQTLLPNQLNFIILYEAAASVHWTFGITQSYGERFLGTISIVPELSNSNSYQIPENHAAVNEIKIIKTEPFII